MQLLVSVRPENGRFVANLHGDTDIRGDGTTEDAAVVALEVELERRQRSGELRLIRFPKVAVTDLVGTYSGEEAEVLREICAEAYRQRDEEKAREFPE